MRRHRSHRLLATLIALTLLGGLASAADVVARQVAEDRLAEGAQVAFGLESRPEVRIRGFLILFRVFVQGRLDEVSVDAVEVTADYGLLLRSVRIEMEGIEAPEGFLTTIRRIMAGDEEVPVVVTRGRIVAEVDEESLNRFFGEQDVEATVTLGDGVVTVDTRRPVLGQMRDLRATGRLELRNGGIGFVPEEVTMNGEEPPGHALEEARRAARFVAAFPDLPGGVSVSELETLAGFVRLTARLDGYTFRLADRPGGPFPESPPGPE